jgi:paraquat-inducible protein A
LNEFSSSQSPAVDLKWINCPFCEAPCIQRKLLPGQQLQCKRCESTVMVPIGKRTLQPPFALAITGLFLLLLATTMPILTFEVVGRSQSDYMITGVIELWRQGYFLIAILVFFAAIAAPAIYLSCVFYVGCVVVLGMKLPAIQWVFNLGRAVNPWNLIPVYSIATLVSVVKLQLLGEVHWEPGARFILAVALISLLCHQISDKQVAVERLEEMGIKITE